MSFHCQCNTDYRLLDSVYSCVLSCYLPLPPVVPEPCRPHFCFEICFLGTLWSIYYSVTLRCSLQCFFDNSVIISSQRLTKSQFHLRSLTCLSTGTYPRQNNCLVIFLVAYSTFQYVDKQLSRVLTREHEWWTV